MSAASWIVTILIVAAGGAAWYLNRGEGRGRASSDAKTKTVSRAGKTGAAGSARAASVAKTSADANPYRATTIRPGETACAAVSQLAGKRFLVASEPIPPLPLPDCDIATCSCRYLKLQDRRNPDGDRRSLGGQHLELLRQNVDTERRGAKRGRRSSDHF